MTVSAGSGQPQSSRGSRRPSQGSTLSYVRRAPIVALLALLLAAAVAIGDGRSSAPSSAPSVSDAAAMPPRDARSSAWYCPGAPASDAVKVTETVTVTNLSSHDSVAAVTVMAAGHAPTGKQIAVAARSMVQVVPAELSKAPHPAVIVEPFSADVVVEQSLNADGELEIGPCATQSSGTWYFANGTTARGTEQWLVLFNPFGEDAIVDVSYFTDEGRQAPEATRGLEVPRRSSIAVPVHDIVRRQALVATVMNVRTGRVFAEQSEIFLPDSGRRGVTASLGAVAPSLEWWFADGVRVRGQTRSIGIANPGGFDTEVDVQVVADGDAMIDPITVALPRDAVVAVTLGACPEGTDSSCVRVPAGLAYSVVVSAASDTPVVAQSLETWTDDTALTGATSSFGVSKAGKRWVFGRSWVREATTAHLAVLNTGREDAVLGITRVTPEGAVEPGGLQDVKIAPGERRVFDLTALGNADAGIVVTASAPVVAERFITRSSTATRSNGVPDRR